MANKVKYGLSNVHYAIVTETETNGVKSSSYGQVKSWPGAVSLNMDPSADKQVFRADDGDYFVTYGDGSYEGELVCAMIPEDIKKEILGYQLDDNGILVESSASFSTDKYFAMMWEFKGDKKKVKHCFYKVSLGRPSISSETTGENGQIDVQTETAPLTAVPRIDEDKYIHVETGDETSQEAYDAWYTNVPVPTFSNLNPEDPDPDPDPENP